MTSLKVLIPPARSTATTSYDHSNDLWFKCRFMEPKAKNSSGVIVKSVPAYLKRQGFRPEDFGDGGAFPEIHVSQYPLGMGRNMNRSNKTLPITLDVQGNVVFDDAVMRQSENSKKMVYCQRNDVIPRFLKNEGDLDEDEELEEKKVHESTAEETKAAIEKIVNARLRVAHPKQSSESTYIKYKPSQQSAAFNSGATERIVRMVVMHVDPLDPPKFKHKRVPKASGSPPVPVLHSPPRPVTVKDKRDWNIPPCISNWKNSKGYTIPLDKRLTADGRGLEDVKMNDNFAKLSEALYVAEEKAREAVSMRSKVQKEMVMKEKERREQELRALAQKARREAASIPSEISVVKPGGDCDQDRDEREKIREERRRERERERRLESAGKKSKITRDRERDISEKVALGMTCIENRGGGEVMYDQRLFNQEKGMDSGFATDDQYNVYEKRLSTVQPTLSTLYKPKKDMEDEMYQEQLHKPKNTERFKPNKAFTGAEKRERPLEFEKEAEEDPFGLAQWACNVKKGKYI